MASLNNIYINEFYRSYFNTNKKRPPWTSHGQALSGLRVLKFDGAVAPRVLKFDSGYAAEGYGGRL